MNSNAPETITNKYEKKTSKKKSPQKMWDIHSDWPECDHLASELGCTKIMAQLLYNRGIDNVQQAQCFLNPVMNDLFDPNDLSDVNNAAERIVTAVNDGEKITIYGDYDVDGITGVSILWHCLKMLGREVEFYVPHRIDEGYGLNIDAIKQLSENGTNLIITVDCGITACDVAEVISDCGMTLIITDHHTPTDPLPKAHAIVHPLVGTPYANTDLCGAGVAFKLAWVLGQKLSGNTKVSPEFRTFLLSALSFCALGTIADVMPLKNENRILTRYGMKSLAVTQNIGIQALLEASGLTGEKINAEDIGFKLAPRLNAAGRMGHARLAIELFTKSPERRAVEIAKYLEEQNKMRQKVERDITKQAKEQVIHLGMNDANYFGIAIAGESWHPGVIGIVASRIKDEFHRPTIIMAIQDGKAVGSCRSITGFTITEALNACSDHLIKFGGHAMAAGLTIALDKIESFQIAFNNYCKENLTSETLAPALKIDTCISVSDLNLDLLKAVNQLAPFGAGNPSVKFVTKRLKLVGTPRTMGKRGEHLSMQVADSAIESPEFVKGGIIRAIAFSKASWEKKLIDCKNFDLVFQPKLNTFNGNTTVEMLAIDIKFNM